MLVYRLIDRVRCHSQWEDPVNAKGGRLTISPAAGLIDIIYERLVLLLAGASAIFIFAASATRAYISSDNWLWVALSLFLYAAGNLVMIRIMREGGLGLAISISAIAQLILVNIIAFAVFNERLTNIQMAGVGLGILAMVLMMWPQKVVV